MPKVKTKWSCIRLYNFHVVLDNKHSSHPRFYFLALFLFFTNPCMNGRYFTKLLHFHINFGVLQPVNSQCRHVGLLFNHHLYKMQICIEFL